MIAINIKKLVNFSLVIFFRVNSLNWLSSFFYIGGFKFEVQRFINRDILNVKNPKIDDYLITLPSSTGTFNFYSTELSNLKHMDFDVDTWMDFGSGNGDNTTYYSRKNNSNIINRILFGEFWQIPFTDKRQKATIDFKKHDDEYMRGRKK